MFHVEVRTTLGTWTDHSQHERYLDAIDQAELVGGRVASMDLDAATEAAAELAEADAERYSNPDDGWPDTARHLGEHAELLKPTYRDVFWSVID